MPWPLGVISRKIWGSTLQIISRVAPIKPQKKLLFPGGAVIKVLTEKFLFHYHGGVRAASWRALIAIPLTYVPLLY